LRLIEIFISQEQWKVNEIQKKNCVGRGTEGCVTISVLMIDFWY